MSRHETWAFAVSKENSKFPILISVSSIPQPRKILQIYCLQLAEEIVANEILDAWC